MRALRACVERVAPSDCSVLLTGETGTGKGEVARSLHRGSPRATAPFVHVNCAALSPSVIESELFGHERGAFTDASIRRSGCFERAEGGTLFLDEVAELAADLQAKLLRVLHDRRYERVGGSVPLAMGARVVAATNRSLQAEVIAGRFRSDLYYRLAVVELEIPPLRQRLEDLEALIHEIGRGLAGRLGVEVRTPTDCARQVLGRHEWPGNVRELMNLLERVAICWPERPFDRSVALLALGTGADSGEGGPFFSPSLSSSVRSPLGFSPSPLPLSPSPLSPSPLSPSPLSPSPLSPSPLSPSPPAPPLSPSPGWDPGTVSEGLAQYGGNISRLARELGLPRSTLRYRLSRLGSPERVAGPTGGSPSPVSSRQLLLPLVEPS